MNKIADICKKIADYFGIIVGFIGTLFAGILMLRLNSERKKRVKAELDNAESKARLEHEEIKDNGNIAIANDTADMLDGD